MKKGHIFIIISLLIAVFAIMIPTMVHLIKNEALLTQKAKKNTTAFQLAEAGIDRGLWKLKEDSDYWDQLTTSAISGYNFDVAYTDIPSTSSPSGSYAIRLTLGSTSNERKIIAIGRDSSTDEVRAIEVTVTKEIVSAAIQAGVVSYSGSGEVHWGPIYSLANLTLGGSADRYFPRKYARGQISCTGGSHNHDDETAGPPTSGPNVSGSGINNRMEWYDQYNVPNIPSVNLTLYAQQAQAAGHYYTDATKNYNGYTDASATVHYCTNAADIKNCFLWGVVIVIGNVGMSGNGDGSYNATVPAEAHKEYQCGVPGPPTTKETPADFIGDTNASGEYPGDAGLANSGGGSGTYALSGVKVNGFLYVGGNLSVTGGSKINGAIIVNGTASGLGNLTVYYRDDLNVEMTNSDFTTTSWKEVKLSWPSGL